MHNFQGMPGLGWMGLTSGAREIKSEPLRLARVNPLQNNRPANMAVSQKKLRPFSPEFSVGEIKVVDVGFSLEVETADGPMLRVNWAISLLKRTPTSSRARASV